MVPFWIVTVGVIALCAAAPEVALWLPRLVLPDLFQG